MRSANDPGTGAAAGRIALALALVTVIGLALSRVPFPYDLGQYEGGTWAPAELVLAGRNPWAHELGVAPPYVMAPYGPLFYALVALGVGIAGPQFWCGRVVATLAMLASAGALWSLARRFSGRRDVAHVAAVAFLAQPAVQIWMAVHRPDAVALAFALAALVRATAPRGGDARAIVTAATCSAGALLLRQTMFLPALVLIVWYAVTRGQRSALVFATITGMLLAVPTAWLQTTSGGGYLWQQYVLPSAVPLGLTQLGTVLAVLASSPATWVVLALVGMAIASHSTADEGQQPPGARAFRRLVAAWGCLAVGLAIVTSARAGSNVNYWLEASAVLALGAALGSAPALASPRVRVGALTALVLAAVLSATRLVAPEIARWRTKNYLDEIVTRLRAVEPRSAPMLSINPELVVYAGRAVWFNDGFQYDGRSPAHREAFLGALRAGVFSAAVLPAGFVPRGYAPVEDLTPPPSAPAIVVSTRRAETRDPGR